MAEIEVLLPKMGESVAEATIIKWLKEEGDVIEMDEPIIEIATDKVDSEVPAPEDGILLKKLFNEGDVVNVGELIALISTGGEKSSTAPELKDTSKEVKSNKDEVPFVPSSSNDAVTEIAKNSANGNFYSPLVRSIATAEGVSFNELETISGSGLNNRITKDDLLTYIKSGKKSNVSTAKVTPAVSNVKSTVKHGDNVEIVEMDRMRKLISKHMIDSVQTAPHVTSFVEADVTNVVLWRNKVKNDFHKREGEKLTFTPIFMEAIAKAIKDFPMINISVDGDHIIIKKDVNIGMAAALPSGNLIVPVIKNADKYNLVGLAKEVNRLANAARTNKLTADEISGGTYTISNVGTFGNVMGTPIINQPQVAILALGAVRKMPAVIETPTGDVIGIRHKMFLSHSYDHRVVDGALGGSFIRKVADYLESFDLNREI
jgi:2-oxoglutarate dehydrogenase E2 component (dihydrolipoamide succinyltransferase)